MDEFEVGQVYTFGGESYRYKGGAATERSSWEAVTPPARNSRLSDFVRMLGHGASQGTSDELAGLGAAGALKLLGGHALETLGVAPRGQAAGRAARSITQPENMGRVRDARERISEARQDHGLTSFAGEAIGGALLPGGGGFNLGRNVAARTGSRLLGAAAGGGAGGAAGGAVYGMNEAPDDARGAGAVTGGAVGGVAGAALGGAGTLARRAAVGGEGTEIARLYLTEHFKQAGMGSPAEVLNRLVQMGPDAVPADAGENLGRAARAAVNQADVLTVPGGPKERIYNRNNNTGSRLAEDLRGGAGLTRSYEESLTAAQDNLKALSEQVFRPLEAAHPIVNGPRVMDALADPQVRPAMERIGVPAGQAPAFTQIQDIRTILRETARDPNAGLTDRRMARQGLGRLDEALREDVPGFAEANQLWMRGAKRVDAHETGRKIAGQPAHVIRRELAGLPDEDARDALRQGILDNYEVALLKRRQGGGRASDIIEAGDEMHRRLRLLADSDLGFQRMINAGAREGRYRHTWRALAGNSTTAEQLADVSNIWTQIPHDKQGIFRMLIQSIQGNTAERQAAWELIGRTLLGEGEEAARRLTADLIVRGSRGGAAGAAAGTIFGQQLNREPSTGGSLFDPDG